MDEVGAKCVETRSTATQSSPPFRLSGATDEASSQCKHKRLTKARKSIMAVSTIGISCNTAS